MAVETNVPWDPESLKLPAILINRIQIARFGTNFRLSLAETVKQPDGPDIIAYRFAAILTPEDIRQMGQVFTAAAAEASANLPTPPSSPPIP